MARVLFILVGLALVGLGVWGVVAWSRAVLMFLEAIVVLAAIFAGLVMIVFTVSDLRAPEPPVETPAARAGTQEVA